MRQGGNDPEMALAGAPSPARPWLGTPGLILLAALANAVLYHLPLYSYALRHLDAGSVGGVLTLVTLFVLATAVTALIVGLVSLVCERLVKPLLMVAALGNSVALYFVQAYGVVLDKAMMGNVFATNWAEASGLFHPRILLYLLLLGVLPCWLLWKAPVRRTPFARRAALVGAVLLVALGWGYANARSWPWIDKNSKVLGGMTMPWSYAINGPRRLADLATPRERKRLPPVTAAAAGAAAGSVAAAGKKTVVMLVIGEAARRENFSLYGYPRPTNPAMAAAGAIALPNARACATYTTAALTCILSPFESGGASWEPLTSYLARSGVDVIWRSNNWGEPPMTVQTFERAQALRAACQGEGCEHDEVLLQGLAERIRASAQDRVFVVLHLVGSHGAAYYTRYPARFEAFKPACKSVELSRCTSQELVNAYDNTILYSDYVVGRAIALLRDLAPDPALLIYLSDHGESLGEYGLYLHGTPYAIAPDVQKDVPFVLWMSDAFRQHKDVAPAQRAAGATHSDANVFHSVMGAFDLRSDVYRPNLDVFAPASR